MSIVFEVNSIACSACGDAIKNAIVSHEPTATVEIDIDKKLVSVDGQTDLPTLKQLITDIGHTPQ